MSKAVLAIAVVVVVAIAGGIGLLLASPPAGSTSTSSSSTSVRTSSSLSSTTTSTSHGMAYVVQQNYNFTVDPQKCNYFQFNNPSNSTDFTGSFTSTPQVAMYLLNLTEFSVAQASGSSIVDYK